MGSKKVRVLIKKTDLIYGWKNTEVFVKGMLRSVQSKDYIKVGYTVMEGTLGNSVIHKVLFGCH